MHLGIDASNIRSGGGITHLSELLNAADPNSHGFRKVIIWGSTTTLAQLPVRPWLNKKREQALENNIASRLLWQRYTLQTLAADSCDLLFVPGGLYLGDYRPFVTMSQNLLPFDEKERARYGISWNRFRFFLLNKGQSATFRRASGIIFLTKYAYDSILPHLGRISGEAKIIPHGIARSFLMTRDVINTPSTRKPFKWLCVSIIDVYKHQWNIALAGKILHDKGYPLILDFIGPAYKPALRRFHKAIAGIGGCADFIKYHGMIPYMELPSWYKSADGFAFGSTCENLPIILLEAMAASLPIVCSKNEPMPSVLRDAGAYFDPEEPGQIAQAMLSIMENPDLRTEYSRRAHQYAREYTWEHCADETFSFLSRIAKKYSAQP